MAANVDRQALIVLFVSLGLATGNWVALWQNKRRLEWVLKPAAQAAVVLGAILFTRSAHDAWLGRYLVPGLTFCLAGDILLLLPGYGFLAGLGAFLIGHLCTIAGLTPTLPPPGALVFVAAALVIAAAFFRVIAGGLRRFNQAALIVPVGLYTAVIGLMLAAAWTTFLRPEWSAVRRVLVIGGATLFATSDGMLAWYRFVSPSRSRPVRVMVSYHLAQMAFAASLALW